MYILYLCYVLDSKFYILYVLHILTSVLLVPSLCTIFHILLLVFYLLCPKSYIYIYIYRCESGKVVEKLILLLLLLSLY